MESTTDALMASREGTVSTNDGGNPIEAQNAHGNNNVTGAHLNHSTSGAAQGVAAAGANSFLPLTRARMRENLDNQDVMYMNNIEEAPGANGAARKARFSANKLSEDEFAVFSGIIGDDRELYDAYLYIRNKILEQWYNNVQIELSKQKARSTLEDHMFENISPAKKDQMFNRCYNFLNRTGKINFGLFDVSPDGTHTTQTSDRTKRAPHMTSHLYKPPLKTSSKRTGRVIILGAGLSGLIAARQLQKFGLEVIVIEARNRVGGRVHTYRKGNFIADLGPTSLNGVVGNPVVVLGKQLEQCFMELKHEIPIYENKVDKHGTSICHQVDTLLARAVEREYHKIIEGTRVMKTNYNITKYRGQSFPVGMAVDWVMKLQEKNIKDEQTKHLKSIEQLYQQLIDSANRKLEKSRMIKKLHGQLCSIKDSTDIGNHKDKGAIDTFNRRFLARDLDITLKEYKLLIEQEEEIHNKISELTKTPPSDTYLSLGDRRLLDWHFAELEYALGCPINKLSVYYDDDEEIFDGSHWMLVHGFNTIVEALKADLDIQLGTGVKKITIGKGGCKVLTYQADHTYSPYIEYTADAVLCTLPLGVLQDCIVPSQQAAADSTKIENSKTAQKGYQPVIFSPPLPKWKTQSLNKLGCGNLNKIILHFDKVFWNHELHLFGVVNHKAISRGEFFLFWHHGRTPTLTGLVSGEAADLIEKLSDVEILERCLTVLRSIYGNANVPTPKEYVVTKWRKDPWAKGAWSYLQTGATGEDYDACAEPVVLDPDEQSFKEHRSQTMSADDETAKPCLVRKVKSTDEVPRLFFAGEHTSRCYFASAHGAVLTGLREAARIANIYLGCPYDDDEEPGIYLS